jgi:hypothetical protein
MYVIYDKAKKKVAFSDEKYRSEKEAYTNLLWTIRGAMVGNDNKDAIYYLKNYEVRKVESVGKSTIKKPTTKTKIEPATSSKEKREQAKELMQKKVQDLKEKGKKVIKRGGRYFYKTGIVSKETKERIQKDKKLKVNHFFIPIKVRGKTQNWDKYEAVIKGR